MSLINYKVLNKFVDINIAPRRLSTPSAMFLPVQFRVSVATACFVKGGDQVLGSGSLVRMNLFSSRLLPILTRNILVMNVSFILATFDSPA